MIRRVVSLASCKPAHYFMIKKLPSTIHLLQARKTSVCHSSVCLLGLMHNLPALVLSNICY